MAAAVNTMIRPWWNGADDQVREELVPGEHRDIVPRQRGQHSGVGQQVPYRVEAEQRGEHRAHRRQVADLRGHRPRTPWARSPALSALGRVAARPTIISEKKIPIDRDMPKFWNVERMPEATPRSRAGRCS